MYNTSIMDSCVINYTLGSSIKCSIEGPLKLMLWAGDCVHNGITDIERLPDYDIYLCIGFTEGIKENAEFLSRREKPGYICSIDHSSPEQMSEFIKDFMSRFSLIDSDYHGNTPKFKPEYYACLLSSDGRAYNIEGINGLIMYRADYMNALETFGPILDDTLNDERRYIKPMLDLAKDNKMPVDMAWTSPDLKDQYYDTIRLGQNTFSSKVRSLNPKHDIARMMDEERLEEYWSQLSDELMVFNKARAEYEAKVPLEELFGSSRWERFTRYLTQKVESIVNDVSEFKEYTEYDFTRVQHILNLSLVAKSFTGFVVNYGFYTDLRKKGHPRTYGLWISKEKNTAVE